MSRTVDSIALLSSLKDQVDRHLSLAVMKYKDQTESALLSRPADGGWNISECLWHLNSYGNYYLPKIEEGLSKATAANTKFTSTWLGAYFTRTMQPGPGMKKYKAFKDHIPPSGIVPGEAVTEFIRQQEWILELLRRAQAADLNRIRIGISIMPLLKLRLGDVFMFLIAHQERHVQQAERIGKN